MADPNQPKQGGQKPFAEFLRELPRHQGESVTLSGRVTQSEKEGHFVLETGGRHLELPIDAVRDYKLEEGASQVHVTLHLSDALRKLFSPEATYKEAVQDHTLRDHDVLGTGIADIKPILDRIQTVPQFPPGPDPRQLAGGLTPFVLATGHHAPQSALALQGASGQVAKSVIQDVHTLQTADLATLKEPLHDTTLKELIYDTIKEISKDPIYDTVKEVYETLYEGGGTIQEGGGTIQEGGGTIAEGGGFPGGGFPGGGGNPGF